MRNKLSFLILLLLFINSYIYANDLYKTDSYFLDKNEVLLYKILNWWSTEAHKDSTKPCNKQIKVKSNTLLNINYNKQSKTLNLYSKKGFAKLLSVFETCENCTLNSLSLEYINKNHFTFLKQHQIKSVDSLTLENVSLNEYKKIKKDISHLSFELEGIVKGLLTYSGKLALHKKGDFFRTCPKTNKNTDIVFRVINTKTKETLLKYKSE